MSKAIYQFTLPILFAATATGCGLSLNASRDTNPVIQDWASPIFNNTSEIFATKASHRLVMLQKLHDRLFTCTEPSPDVAEALTSAVSDALKLAAKDGSNKGSLEIENQFAKMVSTQIAPLLYRTQGLQLYRNAASDLCIDYLNGWITSPDLYMQLKSARYQSAVELIKEELKNLPQITQYFYQSVKAGEGKFTADDFAKVVKAAKGENAPSASPTNGATVVQK